MKISNNQIFVCLITALVASPASPTLDLMQHRQFEDFADYCYHYLSKKIAKPELGNERKVKIYFPFCSF